MCAEEGTSDGSKYKIFDRIFGRGGWCFQINLLGQKNLWGKMVECCFLDLKDVYLQCQGENPDYPGRIP